MAKRGRHHCEALEGGDGNRLEEEEYCVRPGHRIQHKGRDVQTKRHMHLKGWSENERSIIAIRKVSVKIRHVASVVYRPKIVLVALSTKLAELTPG